MGNSNGTAAPGRGAAPEAGKEHIVHTCENGQEFQEILTDSARAPSGIYMSYTETYAQQHYHFFEKNIEGRWFRYDCKPMTAKDEPASQPYKESVSFGKQFKKNPANYIKNKKELTDMCALDLVHCDTIKTVGDMTIPLRDLLADVLWSRKNSPNEIAAQELNFIDQNNDPKTKTQLETWMKKNTNRRYTIIQWSVGKYKAKPLTEVPSSTRLVIEKHGHWGWLQAFKARSVLPDGGFSFVVKSATPTVSLSPVCDGSVSGLAVTGSGPNQKCTLEFEGAYVTDYHTERSCGANGYDPEYAITMMQLNGKTIHGSTQCRTRRAEDKVEVQKDVILPLFTRRRMLDSSLRLEAAELCL